MLDAPRPSEHTDLAAANAAGESVDVMFIVLRNYADRGALQELEELDHSARFDLPGARRIEMTCAPAKRTLVLKGLLPSVVAKGMLADDLNTLLAACRDPATPPHRRIAPEQAKVALRHSAHGPSLQIVLTAADWEWAVRRLMNLAYEIRLMVHAAHPHYAQAEWGASEE